MRKQAAGTVTASHKMPTLQALSSSLNAGTAKGGCLGRGKALGDLRQSVPQNGRVHLHIIDPRKGQLEPEIKRRAGRATSSFPNSCWISSGAMWSEELAC